MADMLPAGASYQRKETLNDLLRKELRAGERIAWQGVPDTGKIFGQAMFIWLFAIPYIVSPLLFEAMAHSAWFVLPNAGNAGAVGFVPIVFQLFGLLFVLGGLVMMYSPFYLAKRGKHTLYAITDQRLLILENARRLNVETYAPNKLINISCKEGKNGYGTVKIKTGSWWGSDRDKRISTVELVGVADAQKVMNLLQDLAVAPRDAG